MSLIKVGLVVGSIVAGLFYWQSQNPEKHAKLMALVPFVAKPKETEEIVRNVKSQNPEKTERIVYQTKGRQGEVMFSDERSINSTSTAHIRVIKDTKSLSLNTNASDQKNN